MESVNQQIEEILDAATEDEKRKNEYDVIVQLDSGFSAATRAILDHALEAIKNRRTVANPREIIPRVGNAFEVTATSKTGAPTASARRRFKSQLASLAAQTALNSRPLAGKQIFEQSTKAFKAFRKHDSFIAYAARQARRGKKEVADYFWSSGSTRMALSRDELADLKSLEKGIVTVHRNRRIEVPRISRVQQLPQNVQDIQAGAWGLAATGAFAAWGAYGSRGQGIRVAVLDTGVDATHQDLQGKVAAFAEFDAAGRLVSTTPRDSDEHGTHVCGTVCGGDASGRWIGVAPDAELAVALVLDGAIGGTDAQVLAGIDWALNQNAHVISMSLGGLSLNPIVQNTYHQAIVSALIQGVPVVTAVGNDGHQTSGLPGSDLFAFGIGATDVTDSVAGFSGGRTQVITESDFIDPRFLPLPYSKPEVSAPGVAVMSSIPGNQYAAFSGTSMATPHVSGAIAVLLSATNALSSVASNQRAFLIQDLLTGSVEELGESGQDHRYGFGRLDVLRAIGLAKEQGF